MTVAIQGDSLRVTCKSKDDLQQVIQLLKQEDLEVPLQLRTSLRGHPTSLTDAEAKATREGKAGANSQDGQWTWHGIDDGIHLIQVHPGGFRFAILRNRVDELRCADEIW